MCQDVCVFCNEFLSHQKALKCEKCALTYFVNEKVKKKSVCKDEEEDVVKVDPGNPPIIFIVVVVIVGSGCRFS